MAGASHRHISMQKTLSIPWSSSFSINFFSKQPRHYLLRRMRVPVGAQQKRGEMRLSLHGMDRSQPDVDGSTTAVDTKDVWTGVTR